MGQAPGVWVRGWRFLLGFEDLLFASKRWPKSNFEVFVSLLPLGNAAGFACGSDLTGDCSGSETWSTGRATSSLLKISKEKKKVNKNLETHRGSHVTLNILKGKWGHTRILGRSTRTRQSQRRTEA